MTLINLCAETTKPVCEADKIRQLWDAPLYYVYPVRGRMTGDGKGLGVGGGQVA